MNNKYNEQLYRFKEFLKEYGVYIISFLLFTYISILSPITSDDYGKYLGYGNSIVENIYNSIRSYTSVNSGRFINEFFARFFVYYKPVWNIVNGLMFTAIIYLMTFKRSRKNKLIGQLLSLMAILAVSSELRRWTYTWVAGNISYIMSFLMVMVYIYMINKYLDQPKYSNETINKKTIFKLVILGIAIGFMMHNITIALLISNILLIIYLYIKYKKYNVNIFIFTIANLFSTVALFLSPATEKRMNNYGTSELGKIDLALKNIGTLIKYIINENIYLIILFSLIFVIFIWQKRCKDNKLIKVLDYISIIYLIVIPIQCIIEKLTTTLFLLDTKNVYSYIIWIIYFIIILGQLLKSKDKEKLILCFGIGTLSTGAMLFSPIVKYGTILCTVFMFITILVNIIQEITFSFKIKKYITWILIVINIIYIEQYILIYQDINKNHNIRMEIINTAKETNAKEIIIPGMGDKIIGGDLLMEGEKKYFKKFYEISDDVNLIIDNGYGVREFVYQAKEDGVYEFTIIPLNDIESYEYAFYIYKDKQLYEKNKYQSSNQFSYQFKEPGVYYVRYFIKDNEGKQSYNSANIIIQ